MKTHTKKTFVTLMMILFSLYSFADGNDPIQKEGNTVNITGKIIDKKNGEPLTGVKVFYSGSDVAVYTDFDGEFTIQAVAKKDAQLSATLISYEEKTIKLEKSKNIKLELTRQK